MELSVRSAIPEDYEEVSEAFSEIDAEHCTALPHVFRTADGHARSREYITSIIDDEDSALFVAQLDDHVAGLVVTHLREAPDIPILFPRRYAVVDTLVVKERFRRLGIGRALMQRAHDWAEAQGVAEMELTVWEFNGAARAFYESLEYSTVSRRMRRAWRWYSTTGEE
jgi:ribosomal protein S18 acetylase RimI-like enzyme